MKTLKIIQDDPYLEPYANAINGRHEYALTRMGELLGDTHATLSDFATGYMYFGLHKVKRSWMFREWAPNATAIYLIGDFNDWEKDSR